MRVLSIFLGVIVVLGGCTKKREYDTLFKENVEDKSQISATELYLYLPSTNESDRRVGVSRPHWMGEEKLVKFEFQEKNLMVFEVERDSRFQGNKLNNKPLMAIPIGHHAYRCVENDHGECTNKEEENSEISWSQKPYFKPSFAELSVIELSFLPISIMNFFEGCFENAATQLSGYELDSQSLNIDLDVSYQTSGKCIWAMGDFGNVNFAVRNHYSFVKLSAIASNDYEPVSYPAMDEGEFGFFTTERTDLSVDHNEEVRGDKVFLHRWNPKKKEIVYLLSDEFQKPEHAKIREATIEAVNAVNRSFNAAEAGVQIVLKNAEGKSSGDLRHSMIVLVEDPQGSGIIGYGPSAANPLNGEILHARVVMYLGTILKHIKYSYEEIVEESRKTAKMNSEVAAGISEGSAVGGTLDQVTERMARDHAHATSEIDQIMKEIKIDSKGVRRVNVSASHRRDHVDHMHGGAKSSHSSVNDARTMEREFKTYVKESSPDLTDLEDLFSRYNVYSAEMVNFEMEVVGAVTQIFGGKEHLKSWNDLSESERQVIIDLVLPHVWVPTLVHEIGHTLGLRHNFAGSRDKANFYSKEELSQKDLEPVEVPYSSVMDYSYQTLNELHTMGKYDVAALRFGYARKVETQEGKLLPVETTLGDFLKQRKMESTADVGQDPMTGESNVKLKTFEYCTDEHVALNAGCARFDEGSTYVEMINNVIESYEKGYKRRNFRNGKKDFSLYAESSYVNRITSQFGRIRLFFELFDRISKQRGWPADSSKWQENGELVTDIRKAADIANDFLIRVLKTPDQHCLLSYKVGENAYVGVVPGFSDAISCFDEAVASAYRRNLESKGLTFEAVVGESGKSFETKKDYKNDNPYLDQIDVQGIWPDKLVAAKTLLSRTTGLRNHDRMTGNFLDHDGLLGKEKLLEVLESLVLDEISGELRFTMEDGEEVNTSVPLNLFDSHQFQTPLNANLKTTLGLSDGEILSFQSELMRVIRRTVVDPNDMIATRELLAKFQVLNAQPEGISPKDVRFYQSGSTRFYALPENKLAWNVIGLAQTIKTTWDLRQKGLNPLQAGYVLIKRFVKPLSRERLEFILVLLQADESPQGLSSEEVEAYNLGPGVIQAYLTGPLGLAFIPTERLRAIRALSKEELSSVTLTPAERVAYDHGPVMIEAFLSGRTGIPLLDETPSKVIQQAMKVDSEMLLEFMQRYRGTDEDFQQKLDRYDQILSLLASH